MTDQVSPGTEAPITGWDIWERYFLRAHGPHWRDRRCGHNGHLCAYCSGAIKTAASERVAQPKVKQGSG